MLVRFLTNVVTREAEHRLYRAGVIYDLPGHAGLYWESKRVAEHLAVASPGRVHFFVEYYLPQELINGQWDYISPPVHPGEFADDEKNIRLHGRDFFSFKNQSAGLVFWRTMIFDFWRDDRLWVFGFPMHKQAATRRERVPASLAEQLSFAPDRDEAVARLRVRDDGSVSILPVLPDMAHYRQIRFYPNPEDALALELVGEGAPNTVQRVGVERAEPLIRGCLPVEVRERILAAALAGPQSHAPRGAALKRHWTADQIRNAARALYDELAEDPPNIQQAEELIRECLPGAVRSRIRPVLAEPEFGNQRRRPGGRRP